MLKSGLLKAGRHPIAVPAAGRIASRMIRGKDATDLLFGKAIESFALHHRQLATGGNWPAEAFTG